MENVFKDARFGDKFQTRDGRMAVLLRLSFSKNYIALAIENDERSFFHLYNFDGTLYSVWSCERNKDLDIIGKWEEESDERLTIAESRAIMSEIVDLKTKLLER